MVTLSKRSTPAQDRVLRIVEGAVLNEADAHGKPRDELTARSIAKRAAGTLTAQWPEVLAVSTRLPAKRPVPDGKCRACERRAELVERAVMRERQALTRNAGRRAPQLLRRPPLVVLWEQVKREMWHLKRSDDPRTQTYIEFLKMIDALQKRVESAKIDHSAMMK